LADVGERWMNATDRAISEIIIIFLMTSTSVRINRQNM